ncbi:MAG: FIG002343: hypothetical protein, partial [uncultured Rubrobacteraceae bacterium]
VPVARPGGGAFAPHRQAHVRRLAGARGWRRGLFRGAPDRHHPVPPARLRPAGLAHSLACPRDGGEPGGRLRALRAVGDGADGRGDLRRAPGALALPVRRHQGRGGRPSAGAQSPDLPAPKDQRPDGAAGGAHLVPAARGLRPGSRRDPGLRSLRAARLLPPLPGEDRGRRLPEDPPPSRLPPARRGHGGRLPRLARAARGRVREPARVPPRRRPAPHPLEERGPHGRALRQGVLPRGPAPPHGGPRPQ